MRRNFHGDNKTRDKMAESNVDGSQVGDCSDTKVGCSVTGIKDQPSSVDSNNHNDTFVGNICNYVPLPEGQERAFGKGNLMFNACFEGGNVATMTTSMQLFSLCI